jgi:hypothetical protein
MDLITVRAVPLNSQEFSCQPDKSPSAFLIWVLNGICSEIMASIDIVKAPKTTTMFLTLSLSSSRRYSSFASAVIINLLSRMSYYAALAAES